MADTLTDRIEEARRNLEAWHAHFTTVLDRLEADLAAHMAAYAPLPHDKRLSTVVAPNGTAVQTTDAEFAAAATRAVLDAKVKEATR